MKLLVAARYYYYGDSNGIEPQFYYLAKVPEAMGHQVDYFDFYYHAGSDLGGARRMFRNLVRSGNYDAVFVATNREEFDQETIETAKQHTPIIAWNSDDEFKWETVSRPKASWYSFMVTNNPDVYERNRAALPNLVHAQWACTGFWDGQETPKDIDFSFVGQAFGKRFEQIRYLQRKTSLVAYGRGTGNIVHGRSAGLRPGIRMGGTGYQSVPAGDSPDRTSGRPRSKGSAGGTGSEPFIPPGGSLDGAGEPPAPPSLRCEEERKAGSFTLLKNLAWRLLPKKLLPYEVVEHLSTIDFAMVNRLWNRTRVSFTPLDSNDGTVRQIKSRVFDMGLSGTLMLSHRAPRLDDYYEPGKEYVPFESLEECADKARYYLRHEAERRRIAEAYARRTLAEHLWRHRIEHVLKGAGLTC